MPPGLEIVPALVCDVRIGVQGDVGDREAPADEKRLRTEMPIHHRERGATAFDDAAILNKFAELATADLGCAQLAAEKARSADVRAYAAILVREHTMARQMARDAERDLVPVRGGA